MTMTKEYAKKYRETHREQIRTYNREYHRKRRGYTGREPQGDRVSQRRRSSSKLREEVLLHYSLTGELSCPCGEARLDALTLDHIHENGAEERRGLNGGKNQGSRKVWAKLRMSGYPPGYQTLCFNCNIVKRREYERMNVE